MKFKQQILNKHDNDNWTKVCTADNENFILKQCDCNSIHEIVLTINDINNIQKFIIKGFIK